MALPLTKDSLPKEPRPGTTPGSTRRLASGINNDFSYLSEAANANDYFDSTDKNFSREAYKGNVLGPVGLGRPDAANANTKPEDQEDENIGYAEPASDAPRPVRRLANETVRRLATTALTTTAASVALRARASAVNLSAVSWGTTVWLFVQLPFAILGMIGFGVTAAVDGLLSGEGGFLAWVGKKVVQGIDLVAGLFGTGLADAAIGLFFLSQMVILAVFILSALALTVQYLLAGMRPLSGAGAGFKIGALLLCCVGYQIPLLNMFPFIIIWMIAVWLFPR